jgi:hypothetical protein
LDKCIICWEQEWEDCFEVQEFAGKEGYIFKVRAIPILVFSTAERMRIS